MKVAYTNKGGVIISDIAMDPSSGIEESKSMLEKMNADSRRLVYVFTGLISDAEKKQLQKSRASLGLYQQADSLLLNVLDKCIFL